MLQSKSGAKLGNNHLIQRDEFNSKAETKLFSQGWAIIFHSSETLSTKSRTFNLCAINSHFKTRINLSRVIRAAFITAKS